jgi:hypothetical protein
VEEEDITISLKNEIKKLKKEMEVLKNEINELEKRNIEQQNENTELKNKMNELEKRNIQQQNKNTNLKEENIRLSMKLKKNNEESPSLFVQCIRCVVVYEKVSVPFQQSLFLFLQNLRINSEIGNATPLPHVRVPFLFCFGCVLFWFGFCFVWFCFCFVLVLFCFLVWFCFSFFFFLFCFVLFSLVVCFVHLKNIPNDYIHFIIIIITITIIIIIITTAVFEEHPEHLHKPSACGGIPLPTTRGGRHPQSPPLRPVHPRRWCFVCRFARWFG